MKKVNNISITIIDYLKIRFEADKSTLQKIQTVRTNNHIQVNENILITFNTGTNNSDYKHNDSIYYDSEYIGTIHHVNQKNRADNTVTIQFANKLFYSGDWYMFYQLLTTELNLNKINIARLDIAKDIANSNLLEQLQRITNSKRIKTKLVTSLRTYTPQYVNNKLDYVKIGKATNNRYIKIYNKSNRLEQEKKDYIRVFWAVNGIYSKNVERFELTLQKDATKQIEVDKLVNPDYLETILKTETEKRFRIIQEQRRGKRIITKDVTPIPFNLNKTVNYRPFKAENKQTDLIALRTIKTMLKTHYLMFLGTDDKQSKQIHKQAIDVLIKDYSLKQYFANHCQYWQTEQNKLRAN